MDCEILKQRESVCYFEISTVSSSIGKNSFISRSANSRLNTKSF